MSSHRQDAEEAPEEHLPTMYDALKDLSDMEASIFHHLNYLITQVTTCTPFYEEATLVIFKPLRDAVVDFLNPVVEAWQLGALVVSYLADLPIPLPSWVAGKYHSMRLNAQSARRCFALLDVAIVNFQAPLLGHLRGSYGLEPLLRALKWLGTSSIRVDILDSLPQLLIEFRKYCRHTMQCLDNIEYSVVGLHDFFSDEGCVGALTEPEEICRRMRDLSQFAVKGIPHASVHRYRLGLKGSKVRVISEYKGREYLREDSTFSQIILT